MPRKYVKKLIRRKPNRRYKRAHPYRRIGSSYVPSGLPKQRIAKLRYVAGLARSSNTGVLNEYKFRANSLYDPDLTGTGHQPMGFDQWATLFNHYTVFGSKITVVANQISATPVNAVTGIYLADGKTAGYTNWTEFAEAKKGTWRLVSQDTTKPVRSVSKFSAKKYFGVKDVMDNQNLRADVTTNPAEEAYFHIWLQAHDLASTTVMNYTIIVDYIVKFTEPKDVAQS